LPKLVPSYGWSAALMGPWALEVMDGMRSTLWCHAPSMLRQRPCPTLGVGDAWASSWVVVATAGCLVGRHSCWWLEPIRHTAATAMGCMADQKAAVVRRKCPENAVDGPARGGACTGAWGCGTGCALARVILVQ
jgi:hypothetical protein